jgi:hypothetical protein
MVGVTHGSLSQLERYQMGYRERMLTALADALDCTPADLLGHDPSTSVSLRSIWERASAAQREVITELAETIVRRNYPPA